MKRINKILNHDLFKSCINKTNGFEADRKFCRHNMEHFLAVARIAMLLNYEKQLGIEKELIYAAALLHDIGRYQQYEDGTPHEQASACLAPEILAECGFDDKETDVIVAAIANHRNKKVKDELSLNGLIYCGDKLSRPCYVCPVETDCNWKAEKKNKSLEI